MSDILHRIRVDAPLQRVFDAVTTLPASQPIIG